MKSIRNALNAAAETLSVKTPSSSSSSSSSPHDLRGKVVSVGAMRIKCGDAIADGGMATVYRGRVLDDPGNNIRDVAVKQMLLPHDSSVSELDARREVELHARLSHHECVVAQLAHDVRLVPLPGGDGDCYRVLAVLELCSESLADALATAASRGEYMEETEALRAFHAAASAIARMHAETPSPLLHRDVKPENVLRARDGDGGGWKLCDFGSARVGCVPLATANDRARAEAEMVRVTTPPYRSPELWDAFRFAEIGPPSDVWALGCVLYQVRSGYTGPTTTPSAW
jgi:serine/threonine protein kinase